MRNASGNGAGHGDMVRRLVTRRHNLAAPIHSGPPWDQFLGTSLRDQATVKIGLRCPNWRCNFRIQQSPGPVSLCERCCYDNDTSAE